MGMSWGARLGLLMVREAPHLFAAYVGTAQPVGRRGDSTGYAMALATQRERGNSDGVAALERVGPPPYVRFEDFLVRQQFTNPPVAPMSPAEIARSGAMMARLSQPDLDAPYTAYRTLPEGFDGASMFIQTLRALYREWDWEIRDSGLSWPIPMFVFQGANDLNAPEPLARAWMDEIAAPTKGYATIPGAGHNTLAFADELLALLRAHVAPGVLP